MSNTRLSHDQQVELALDDLIALGAMLDEVSIVTSGTDQVSIHFARNERRPARVLAYDSVGEALARQLVATAAKGHKVVVANRISLPARSYLASQGWSWLDRRIGAHIPIGQRDIEVRYAESSRQASEMSSAAVVRLARPADDGPIRGRAGIAYAAAVLCSPERPPSFRSVSVEANMSPTAISNAARRLSEAGLLGSANKPTLPDLFWALADVWNPLKVAAVAAAPDPSDPTIGQTGQLAQPGWVLGGDLAAAELGAPLFSTDNRPWLWVPTQVELRRAERTYGPAAGSDRAATLASPPTPLVCQRRRPPRPGGAGWPLPHPVFAALDLARDRERGRQILEQWSPEGAELVWR